MYMNFYNFTSPPFRLVPDQSFFFGSDGHKRALSYLKFGLQQGDGFIVVTGEVGAGKSTLVSKLFAELDGAMVSSALLATTQIDAEDALRLILAAFKIGPIPTDKASMLCAFDSFLRAQREAKRRVLLVIDEAQGLPMRTLEELRMLSNILIDGRSAFQCFMLGQPQLVTLMARSDLEQFRQRIVASCHIGPLAPSETRDYIEHRLKLAGWAGDPVITAQAFDRIHHATGGIPRRINLLCNRLLFYGALEQLHELDAPAVDEVVADLAQEAINPVKPDRNDSLLDDPDGQPSGHLPPSTRNRETEALLRLPTVLCQLDRRLDTLEHTLNRALDLLAAHIAPPSPPGHSPDAVNGNAAETPVHGLDTVVADRARRVHWWTMRRKAP